jgi:hypothetical protein
MTSVAREQPIGSEGMQDTADWWIEALQETKEIIFSHASMHVHVKRSA